MVQPCLIGAETVSFRNLVGRKAIDQPHPFVGEGRRHRGGDQKEAQQGSEASHEPLSRKGRNGFSIASTTAAATAAMAAIIRKKWLFSMPPQKLPNQPWIRLPVKLVASQTPIIIEA